MTCTLFQLSVIYKARIGDESLALQIAVNKLATAVEINDHKFILDIELLRDQFNVNDMTLTCWKLFQIKRHVFTTSVSLVIYYLFITLQMNGMNTK